MKTWIASALVMMAPLLAGHAQAQTCTQLPQRITDNTGSSNSLAGWTAADGDGGGTAPTTWTIGALGFNAAQHWDDQTNLAVAPPATSGIDTLTQTTPPTRVSGGSILQFDIAWNNAQYGLPPNAYDGNRAQLTISYAGITYVRAQTATAIFRANTLANDTDPGPGTVTSALVGDANLAILGGATLLAGAMPSPFRAADGGAPVWATITIRLPDNIPQTGAFVIGVQRIQAGFDQNRTDDFYIRNVTLAPRTLCLRKQTPGPGTGGGNFSFTTTNLDTNYTTSQATAGGPYDNGPLTMNTTGTTPVVLPDPDGGTTGAQPALVMGNTVTVTETIGTTGFALTGATCDNGVTASIAGNQATLSNIDATTGAGIMVTCTLTNARPRIRLQKALPNGRALATDQFGLTITGPRSGVGTVATVTTTGTGTTATGTADFTPGDTGGSYTLSETAVGTTVPALYATNYLCTNATAGSTTTMPSGSGTSFNLVPAAGDDVTCTFTNALLGSIVIIKDAVPNNAQDFAFTTTGTGLAAFSLDDDANATLSNTRTFTALVPGSYSVTETATAGWDLSALTCVDPDNGSTVNLAARTATIDVDLGETITCTYTNTQQGSIVIVKDAVPNNAQDFAFTTTGTGLSGFSLDDDADATLPNTRTFTGLAPGSFSVTETALAGWTLSGLVCSDPDGGSTVNVASRVATIDLDAGETVTCTYTNTQQGSIVIIKDAVPNSAQDFAFTTTGTGLSAFSLDDDADATLSNTRTFTGLTPGSYGVTETALAGWNLSALACVDPDSGTAVNLGSRVATIDLDAGETVTCTYTNTQQGSITIVKDAVPNSAQDFAFTTTGTGLSGFSLDDDADATLSNTRTFTGLVPGSYSVTETAVAGWSLTGLTCVDPDNGSTVNVGTRVASIDLDAAENVTCTYTNTQLVPALSVTKASNGPWTVGQTGATYTLTVTNTGTATTTGTMTVRDQLPTGIGIRPATGFTAAAGWTCSYSDEAAQSATTISPNTGMVVTCTSGATIPAGGTATLTLPVVVVSSSPASVTNYASVGGGGDAFNGGTAPTAGASCTDATHCTSVATSVTPSPPAPATCPVGATPVNLYATPPFQSNFFTDSTTETRTATLIAAANSYAVGTGSGGRFVVNMNWRWSPGFPLPSSASTMTLRVNGVDYARMTTQAGYAGYATLVALNGATLFDGTTTMETNRTSTENIWVTLPATVTSVTGLQMAYTGGATGDDFFFSSPALLGCSTPVDLAVTKTNTPAQGANDLPTDTYTPGIARTYAVVVSNTSTSYGVLNMTVSDPVPAGVNAATVSWTCTATSGGAVCGAASGTGALNDTGLDLPAGAVATYQVTMTVPAGYTGDLTNTASITPPGNIVDGNAANNTATDVDQSVPLLTIRKVSIGGVDSFGFTGTNGVVTQTLVTATAGTPISGATQSLTTSATATTVTESTTPATYRVTDITCTGLGAGGTATPDLANRVVSLDAAATAAGANIVCTFTNTLQQADIQVVKTATPNPVVSGDVVTYTLVVSNNGPNAVTNAVLSDVPSAGQTCTTPSTTATCTATGGASCPAATVPVATLLGAGMTIPTLPVGGQVTVTLQCTVNASGQ